MTFATFCNRFDKRSNRDAFTGPMKRAHVLLGVAFGAAFIAVTTKMVMCAANAPELPVLAVAWTPPPVRSRPDIVDRKGRLLATDIRAYWLYANPQQLVDADEAAEKISTVFRDLDQGSLAKRFHDKSSRFEWVKRSLTPNQAEAVYKLGVPGFYLINSPQRVYPAGNTGGHILGVTGEKSDKGDTSIGIEKYIDDKMLPGDPPAPGAEHPAVRLSIDLGVQHVLEEELGKAAALYRTEAAMGLILDVNTGEVIASASLPDFDPNHREEAFLPARQNRILGEKYELGSVFKSFTIAMALDQDLVTRSDRIDSNVALKVGRFTLRDKHSHGVPLSVEDIFIHSSNTGAARIALSAGVSRQREFLKTMGLFDRAETEAGISPKPSYPPIWRPANAMTIAYGHGISVPPLVFAAAEAALVNGGRKVRPTYLAVASPMGRAGDQLIKPETSAVMRDLMRLTVMRGTGRRAAVEGLAMGGKTGTALKVKKGRYTNDVMNSFVAAFPINNPKYLLLVTLDEPKMEKPGIPNEAAHNAAPTAGAILKRVAPMLDILPTARFDEATATSYDKAIKAPASQISYSRNKSHELGGSGQRYSAYRRPAEPRGYRDYRAYRE